MSASVSVGFAPATTPLIATGAATAPGADGEGADTDLFAALLALLGPEAPTGEVGATTGIPAPVTLPEEQAATPLLDLGALPDIVAAASAATGTPEGKTLLKDLGAALIAINEALEAGRPIEPALERELGDSLNAIAAYLGGLQLPTAPTATGSGEADPPITGAASASSILPVTPDLPGAADLPGTDAAAAEQAAANAAPAAGASSTPDTPDMDAAPIAPAPPAMVEAKPVPPVLAELGKLIKSLGAELERQLPELARQLSALGDKLETGDVADDILAKLGIPRTGATTNPDLEHIVAALAAPVATPRPVAPQQPFSVPTLALPDAVAPVAEDDTPADPASATTRATETGKSSDTPVLATTAPIHAARPETKPADADPRPAAQAAAPAADAGISDTAATAATTPDPGAATTQIGATAAATGTRAIHAAYLSPVQQINLPQVAFEVVRQFEAGNSRFQIRLDPPELGRIDVKLDVDKAGTINARMVVERPETLDLMQRDQRALQQALQQAGLDGSKTNLEFSLRQNPFRDGGTGGDGRGQQPGFVADASGNGDAAEATSVSTLYRGTATAGGVNLFV